MGQRSALLALGFTTTVAQVLLVRELVAVFYGNELVLGLILAAWLAWGALGAGWSGRFASDSHQRERTALATGGLALLGLLPALQMLLVRAARGLLRVPPGALVEFGPMMGVVLLSVAPVCLLAGALFPVLARCLAEAGQPAGRAYLWECAGAATGGALFSFLFIRYLDPFQTAALILTVDLAAALLLAPLPSANSPRAFLPLALLLLALLLLAPAVHRATLRWEWSDLAFAADSPYGRIVIQARDTQRVFYENGLLMFETQMNILAHVQRPLARR